MPHAQVNGVSLYYEVHGRGDPLVLIAGQGSDHRSWDVVREDFARQHQVIVFDHRGTGLSDKPRTPAYSTRGFAADVIGLLDHLGIRRAHAYGVSMGGRVCQWLGIEHGSRVGALVLGCTTPGNAHGVARSAAIQREMANRPESIEAAVDQMVANMVSHGFAVSHPEYVESIRQRFLNPIPDYARRLHFTASEEHDAWDRLPEIAAPTLVIHGDSDLVNPTANARLLADRIHGAELHIIPGGRHGYFVEFRATASHVVTNFLRRHPLGYATS